MANSSFQGVPFDWDFGEPKRALDAGMVVLSGQVIVYAQSDLDQLFGLWRAVNRRAAGDPSVGGTAYADYWGPDPSGPLVMSQPLVPPPITPLGLVAAGSGSGLSVPGFYQVAYNWRSSIYGVSPAGPSTTVLVAAGQYIDYTLPTFPDGVQSADMWLLGAPGGVALGLLGNTTTATGGIGTPGTGGTPPLAGFGTTFTAILSKFEKSRTLPGGVHFCDAEFTCISWPPVYA